MIRTKIGQLYHGQTNQEISKCVCDLFSKLHFIELNTVSLLLLSLHVLDHSVCLCCSHSASNIKKCECL